MLTEARIRSAKPRPTPYKLSDGRGLYLLISPAGGRLWRVRYRYAGRENMLGVGAYPEVSLRAARERAEDARRQVGAGADPAAAKRAARDARADTFRALALEWLGKQRLASATLEKARWTFNDLLFPYIGDRPVRQLTAPDILGVLRRIEVRREA